MVIPPTHRGDAAALEPDGAPSLRPRIAAVHVGIGQSEPALRGAVLAAGLVALATAVIAYPVVLNPATRLFGTEIVGRHHDAFTVIAQFETPLVLGPFTQPGTDLPGALIARIAGGVAACNIIVLASFPLAALSAYVFVYRLTRSTAAAALAAPAFAFSAFHLAHATYHPHVAQVQWIPLYFLALLACLQRCSLRRAGWLAAAAAAVTLTNFYGGFIAAMLTPALVGAAVLRSCGRRGQDGGPAQVAGTVAVLAGIAIAGLAYVAAAAPDVWRDPDRVAFQARDLSQHGAVWWAYLLPPVWHPLLGDWSARMLAGAGIREGLLEQQIFLGWALLALAAAGVASTMAGRRDAASAAVPMLSVLGGAAFLCSLAPGQSLAGIDLPDVSALLHGLAPMFRSYARFAVVVTLTVAAVAGIGFARLVASRARWQRAAGWTLAAAVCLELPVLPLGRSHDVLPTSGHRWLAAHPPGIRVLDLQPATPADASVPLLLGRDLRFMTERLGDVGDPAFASTLAAHGFTHAVYRRPGEAARWLDDRLPDGFHVVRRSTDSVVLEVVAPSPAITVTWAGGFHDRERDAAGTWRWMGARGRWSVVNRTGAPLTVSLEIELEALASPRRLDVIVEGHRAGSLTVPPRRARHRMGPFTLGWGETVLEFVAPDGAVAPDALLGNGDPRPVSVAIWTWTWLDAKEPAQP